jgi:hypothetical protein
MFMLASLFAMCVMASRTIPHDSTRQTL